MYNKIKKVFLDDLPKKGKCINWKESVGYKIHFIYDDIEDEVEIIGYKNSYLTIKYRDKVKIIQIGNFTKCKLGNLFNIYTVKFKIEIGTTFKDNKRDIVIIDREIREVKIKSKKCKSGYTIEKRKYYKYKCLKDKNEDWILEGNLLAGYGCNVCNNRKALLGVNTIWDKARWMCDLGVSEKDAKTHTVCSTDEIEVICPYCKEKRNVIIYQIYINKSIACKNCSDGTSYPNKYKYEFYNQLLIQGQIKSLETEYKIENKKYDIFVELNNGETLIDENHGCQHGKFIYNGDLLLVKEVKGFGKIDEIKNDSYKCKLAYENGIDNYIQSDCTISDPNYIKHSIENSWLADMFDLSNINWDKCDEYALKNIVKEVSEYWKQHREVDKKDITVTNLIDIFKLDRSTIIKYLKKGNKIGWCNYDTKEENRRSGKKNGKKVLVYDLNMNYITEGESATWLQKHSIEKFGIYLDSKRISEVATGKKYHYKGFIFKHAKTIDI